MFICVKDTISHEKTHQDNARNIERYVILWDVVKRYKILEIVVISTEVFLANTINFPFYRREQCVINQEESSRLFDQNKELLQFLHDNIESEEKIKIWIFAIKNICIQCRGRYTIAVRLLNNLVDDSDFMERIEIREKVIIYGCGNIGKCVSRLLKNRVQVLGFVDELSWETESNGVEIFKLEDYDNLKLLLNEVDILVTLLVDFEEIEKRILYIYKDEEYRIIQIKELLERPEKFKH